MRNMSFMLTTPQMRARTKDVTRRLGWWFLTPSDLVQAVEKGQGLKKGEHVKPIYIIKIIRIRPEQLQVITKADVIREGFPDMSVDEFVAMFCKSHKGCTPETFVNRIEFRQAATA